MGQPIEPAIAIDNNGNVVVSWSYRNENGYSVIYARRYNNAGEPQGPEFQVSASSAEEEHRVSTLAMDANGHFVIAWNGNHWNHADNSADFSRIYIRRYLNTGEPQGDEIQVVEHAEPYLDSFRPSVASTPDGNFVVTWDSPHLGPGQDLYNPGNIYAQRYTHTGEPQGNLFRVNPNTTGLQDWPAIAIDASGQFVITWRDYLDHNIYAQRYTSTDLQ